MSTTVDEALGALAATRAELLAWVARRSEAENERVVYGTWSVKNVLAHLAAWETWVVGSMPARLETGSTPEPMRERVIHEDAFNAAEVAARAHLSLADTLAELAEVRELLLAYLASLDPATMARQQPWAEWQGTLPEYLLRSLRDHERQHLDELRALLG